MTAEWVAKAEGDFSTLLRESRARKDRNPDAICFHAQQCAEKYLKARLCEAGIDFAKVHDLVALLHQVLCEEPAWELFRADLAYLSDFAVAVRYPGERPEPLWATESKRLCVKFRSAARTALALDKT